MTRARAIEITFFALRVVAGVLFALHGAQKVFGLFGLPAPMPLSSEAGIAGVIELVCGTLIALGLFTRLAAFLASGEMAVAYIQVHWKLAFDAQLNPLVNHGELAVLYCFLFLCIAASGGGRFSIDHKRGKT
ncbi:MAG: DoxX family protein [Myxococcales bacterium]|nr:DoxX family protein [Myxococcales bacterium]